MQKKYPNFKYLIHDDDKAQKYYVVIVDRIDKLSDRKMNLGNKTDESYLGYTYFNLIALITTKLIITLLDKQIKELQQIVMNNQKISVIDANKVIYDNDVFN